ncbi:MAG: hypothetical protein JO218_16250 [Burkholderiales bacterium]|nr:hypothetical protein [Burkholderiales bacterium]
MNEVVIFLRQHFHVAALMIFAWLVFGGLASLLFRLTRDKPIVARTPVDAVFSERFSSGRSLRHWWMLIGSANGCLCISLTRHELKVAPEFPFSLFFLPEIFDLDVAVPLGNVRAVARRTFFFKPVLRIEYEGDLGERQVLELILRKPEAFEQALYGLLPRLSATTSS